MKKIFEKIQTSQSVYYARNGHFPSKLVIEKKYAENNFEQIPVSLFGMEVEVRESGDMEDGTTFYLKGYRKTR